MLDMIFLVASGDVAAPQCHPALSAYEIKPPEVISFAERLLLPFRAFDREELGSDNVATVHALETIQVEDSSQRTNKRSLHHFTTRRACSRNCDHGRGGCGRGSTR